MPIVCTANRFYRASLFISRSLSISQRTRWKNHFFVPCFVHFHFHSYTDLVSFAIDKCTHSKRIDIYIIFYNMDKSFIFFLRFFSSFAVVLKHELGIEYDVLIMIIA